MSHAYIYKYQHAVTAIIFAIYTHRHHINAARKQVNEDKTVETWITIPEWQAESYIWNITVRVERHSLKQIIIYQELKTSKPFHVKRTWPGFHVAHISKHVRASMPTDSHHVVLVGLVFELRNGLQSSVATAWTHQHIHTRDPQGWFCPISSGFSGYQRLYSFWLESGQKVVNYEVYAKDLGFGSSRLDYN